MNSIINTQAQALENARQLIAAGQLEDAISLLITVSKSHKQLYQQALALSSKFNDFRSRKNFGELSEQDIEVKRGAITYSLLEITGDLEKVTLRDESLAGKSIEEMVQAGARVQNTITNSGSKFGVGNTYSSNGNMTLNINRRKFLFSSLILGGVILALLYFWPQFKIITDPTEVHSEEPYAEFLGKWESVDGDRMVKTVEIGQDYIGVTGQYHEGHFKKVTQSNGVPKMIFFGDDGEFTNEVQLVDQNSLLFSYWEIFGPDMKVINVKMKRM